MDMCITPPPGIDVPPESRPAIIEQIARTLEDSLQMAVKDPLNHNPRRLGPSCRGTVHVNIYQPSNIELAMLP